MHLEAAGTWTGPLAVRRGLAVSTYFPDTPELYNASKNRLISFIAYYQYLIFLSTVRSSFCLGLISVDSVPTFLSITRRYSRGRYIVERQLKLVVKTK